MPSSSPSSLWCIGVTGIMAPPRERPNRLVSGRPSHKRGAQKTYRRAVETYDSFVTTLMANPKRQQRQNRAYFPYPNNLSVGRTGVRFSPASRLHRLYSMGKNQEFDESGLSAQNEIYRKTLRETQKITLATPRAIPGGRLLRA